MRASCEKFVVNVGHAFEELGITALGGTPDPSLSAPVPAEAATDAPK
jgi:hypothetical protein